MIKTFKQLFLAVLCTLLFLCSSCLRLDDNLFNPDNTITEYKFDNYTGEVDFRLGNSYTIPQNKINRLTFTSQTPGESGSYTIHGVYLGDLNRIATDTVIMYCHGNRDHMDFYWQRAKLLANTGQKNRYGVLMIDYRGYGLSEGEPSESGLYADVNTALTWLKQNGLTSDRLIMYGFSMGTAPATIVAAIPISFALRPAKLILEAPFASAAVMVQDASRLSIPGTFVTDLKINNAEEIKKVQQPFLWIHGIDDDFLSIHTHGEIVYQNYGGSQKTAIRVPGADHDEVPLKMGFNEYLAAINNFIRK
ncbi:alpha/beta hydrolase [Botryobacter ruber]|uniref:alpha/beta hydrolase n=1 Tax=Botryobacter ruber TaxID=2171629 RepID=UPI000E0C4518|nr:alpha/beta hydrolase [Botryobacter ruber]